MFLQRGDSSAVHDVADIKTRGVARFASERRAVLWEHGGHRSMAYGVQEASSALLSASSAASSSVRSNCGGVKRCESRVRVVAQPR